MKNSLISKLLKEKALEYFGQVELITQEDLISTFIHEARGDFALNVLEIDIEKLKELIQLISIEKYKDLIYPLIKEHQRSLRFAKTFIEYYDNIDERIILNNFKIVYEDEIVTIK